MSRLRQLREVLASDRCTRRRLADGSGVLVDVERMRVLTLNETGMLLLEEIAAGADSAGALERRLTTDFEIDAGTARRDVEELLGELERLLLAGRKAAR